MEHEGTLPKSLDEAIIEGLPETAFYISNFIAEAEEEALLEKINSAPQPQWHALTHRRLQALPSRLTENNVLLDQPLPRWLLEPFWPRLRSIPVSADPQDNNIFSTTPHQAPNHCLINEYPPGIGIFPHEDGPAYAPIVATVSLSGHTVLDIYDKQTSQGAEWNADNVMNVTRTPKWRILQERRSLLITTGRLYRETLHGIAERTVDMDLHGRQGGVCNWALIGDKTWFELRDGKAERTLRTSLTFRDVLKVKKIAALKGILGIGRK